MRILFLLTCCGWALAQVPDPAYEPLSHAYSALKAKQYDAAITGFHEAIRAAPQRASIYKDLAYTELKIGENELARDGFEEAMRLDPTDFQVAMEFAFLCNESKREALARRIFDRIRKTGNATAEQAFQNIDGPLAAGIARWQEAIRLGADNFSSHYELAALAEKRGELALAAEHYEKAWRLLPERRSALVDLGRVWQALNRADDATAALLAASRGGQPMEAGRAREMLPNRYPYVAEFQHALALDPANIALRRELAYLLLRMGDEGSAEREFQALVDRAGDLLAATQLGFLLFARGETEAAQQLFDRVLAGADVELANRVRAVLHAPQQPAASGISSQAAAIDAREMAERSFRAGYMKDALKYLRLASESDPADYGVMLKLGWTYNMLHEDLEAYRWFGLARKSPDAKVSSEARHAWSNLRGEGVRLRITGWAYPLFSTRWHDLFGYGQIKAEYRIGLGFFVYSSARLVGDSRLTIGAVTPQYLSESSVIAAVGARSNPWHGVTGWFEAGSAISYINGHMLPDYRGGVSAARMWGQGMGGERGGWFADTTLDGVFVSRFGNDFLVYSQSRGGYSLGPKGLRAQLYWNGNVTFDDQRQYWANFMETGPGIRIRAEWMPPSMFTTFNAMRGSYLINAGNPRGPNFNDFRLGVWYAFIH